MKRLALGLLLASIAEQRTRADMPAPSAVSIAKAPVVSPVTNWSGFYIGAMGGYATEVNSDPFAIKGGFAGGTLGYNWQSGMFVAGIEADGAWANIGQTVVIAGIGTVTDKVQSLATVRGRVGVAFDQVLLYGTGGFAWANNKISASVLGLTFSDSQVHTGWTAGAGMEWMFMPRWSLKAEYLYRRFDSKNYFVTQLPPGFPSGPLAMHSGQFGVNYHF